MNKHKWLQYGQPRWNSLLENRLKKFPVWVASDEWSKGRDLHIQPGLELHVTLEGSGVMGVGNQQLLQSARSVVLFRGSVPHYMLTSSGYKRTVVCIRLDEEDREQPLHASCFEYLADCSWIPEDSCLGTMMSPLQFHEMIEMCTVLQHELQAQEVGWERIAIIQALQIMMYFQRITKKIASFPPLLTMEKTNDLVQLCSDYVSSHISDELTLKSVAKKFAVSEAHLTRSFRKEFGISFYQYVLIQRVTAGRRLLLEAPDVPIAEIAELLRFPSSSAFSQYFKSMLRVTPSVFRRHCRKV